MRKKLGQWKGFITESKLYMGYPGRVKGYREGYRMTPMEQSQAVKFWLRLPVAYCKFTWYGLRDSVRIWWARLRAR